MADSTAASPLVTGAGRGIGAAIAAPAGRAMGASVVVNDVDAEPADGRRASEIAADGGAATAVVADVARRRRRRPTGRGGRREPTARLDIAGEQRRDHPRRDGRTG